MTIVTAEIYYPLPNYAYILCVVSVDTQKVSMHANSYNYTKMH